ncbi:hypothetical protein GGX14DRAFT_566911 [Mycena pura]|uniref:Uncharacterized protein n=1 Tax=Mycena pura TaxID=153505 RepID=A0AAD6VDE6_9AGAR|nr:hypothetical protein GGX14DRAFT_566911 [Mycena pura]
MSLPFPHLLQSPPFPHLRTPTSSRSSVKVMQHPDDERARRRPTSTANKGLVRRGGTEVDDGPAMIKAPPRWAVAPAAPCAAPCRLGHRHQRRDRDDEQRRIHAGEAHAKSQLDNHCAWISGTAHHAAGLAHPGEAHARECGVRCGASQSAATTAHAAPSLPAPIHRPTSAITEYKFTTTEELPTLLRVLRSHGLVVAVEIMERMKKGTNFWALADTSIRECLTTCGIVIRFAASAQHPPPYTFEHSPWEVVGPRAPIQAHNRVFSPLGLLERDFTHVELSGHTKRVRHPNEGSIRLIFVAPRWGHLQGPLPGERHEPYAPVHPCFPLRVFEATGLLGTEEDDSKVDCFDECPGAGGDRDDSDSDDNTTLAPEPRSVFPSGLPLKRESAPQEDENPPKRQKSITIIDDEEIVVISDTDSEMDDAKDETAPDSPDSTALLRELIETAGTGPVQRLSYNEVLEIQTLIMITSGNPDAIIPLEVSGPTVEAVAATLLEMLQWYHEHPDMDDYLDSRSNKSVDLTVPMIPAGIFHTGRKFNVYTDPNNRDSGANGEGPQRAVYVAGLNARLKDGSRWAPSSGFYYRPQLHSIPDLPKPARRMAFTLDGTWAAMFLIQLGVGPDPLCPFFILAAMQTDRNWVADLTLSYINALDPTAALLLAPWFQITPDQTFKFPRDSAHPGLALAAHHLGIALTEFSTARSVEEHRALHLRLLCHFFYGTYDPWAHPEFKAFVTGFDLRLKGNHTLLSHFTRVDKAKAFLVSVYNRRIQSVDQAIGIISFTTPDSVDTLRDLLYEQFQLRFLRWIRGTGYPQSLRGTFIESKKHRAERKNPLIRAQSFISSISGMPMIPLDPIHRFTIRLAHDTDAANDSPITLHFHDCTDVLDISINRWLENVLLQPVKFDDLATVTDFDHWMSAECSLAGADYNDI